MGSQDILDDSSWGPQKRFFGFSFGGYVEGGVQAKWPKSGQNLGITVYVERAKMVDLRFGPFCLNLGHYVQTDRQKDGRTDSPCVLQDFFPCRCPKRRDMRASKLSDFSRLKISLIALCVHIRLAKCE